jgi:hypothetical protein
VREEELHYRDLEITHRAFYMIERRGVYYDNYLKSKDVKQWTDSVSTNEVEKLLRFISSWDRFFIGGVEAFQQVYSEIYPELDFLKNESIESVDLNNSQIENALIHIFDKMADGLCSNHQSTDASKILHTLLPNLMVMWDRKIREGVLGDVNQDWGTPYVWKFLPKMQKNAKEAIASYSQENSTLAPTDAKRAIERMCKGNSLAKLLDQHNYVLFTRTKKFKELLEWALKSGKITSVEHQRLLNKLPQSG